MQIYVHVSRFGGLLGDESQYNALPATLEDLALAVVTAGRSSWSDTLDGGIYRLYEIAALILKTQAYVQESPTGVSTTDLYRNLDATEKGSASYRLGMGIAKLVAEHRLGVPWLRHVDPLIRQQVVQTTLSTHERPDMVGQGNDRKWHVVEAKGRSSSDSSAIRKGLQQAAAVDSVAGDTPATRCVCLTDLRYDPFYVDLVNVATEEPAAYGDFDIADPALFNNEYYSLIRGLSPIAPSENYAVPRIDNRGSIGSFRLFPLPGTSVAIGIHSPVYEHFLSRDDQNDSYFWPDYLVSDDFHTWVQYWREYRYDLRMKNPEEYTEQRLSISQDGYLLLRTR